MGGAYPQADPAEIKRRVNAALNAVPSERRTYMRQKIRFAAAVAVIIGVLAGSALAVASRLDVLGAFFEGDPAPAQSMVNSQIYSDSNGDLTLSVTSSAADTSHAYLLVTVEANSAAGQAALADERFGHAISPEFLTEEEAEPEEGDGTTLGGSGIVTGDGMVIVNYGLDEAEELRTDTSRTWKLNAFPISAETTGVLLTMHGQELAEGLAVEVPLTPAQPVVLELHADGPGMGDYTRIEGAPVTLERVLLTPLSLQVEYTTEDEDPTPPLPILFLQMEDGSLRTWYQLTGLYLDGATDTSSGTEIIHRGAAFREILDLSQVEAVVFNGLAYPLDGGKPREIQVPASLLPFQIPFLDGLGEQRTGLIPVRALCEGLGGSCLWDGDSQSVTMTCQGVTVVLTLDSTTALVDGEPVELREAVRAVDGRTAAPPSLFAQAWNVSPSAAYASHDALFGGEEPVAWLVIP